MIKFKVTVNKKLAKGKTEAVIEAKVKSVCQQIFDGVIRRSPVDTGSYRASWTVQFDSPNTAVVNGGKTGSPLPPPVFVWPLGYKLGTPVYIANGQPYAQRLENGWSGQAPAGVMRVTLAELKYL